MIFEYMTLTDGDNITHPYLCESWSAGDDLKTWTFNVRKGVKFNNGDTFTADDCIFSINQWLNKDVKSSLLGLVGSYLDPTGIEKSNVIGWCDMKLVPASLVDMNREPDTFPGISGALSPPAPLKA